MADGKQIGGDHYARMAVQPWEAMEAWMPREQFCGYLLGSAIAYLARSSAAGLSGSRGGRRDIEKAAHYLEKLLETMPEATTP